MIVYLSFINLEEVNIIDIRNGFCTIKFAKQTIIKYNYLQLVACFCRKKWDKFS